MMFAHAALYVFYSLYLERLGYSKFSIGVMWTIGVVAEIVFFYFQGRLFARVPLGTILAGTFVLAAVRFGLTGYFPEALWLMAAVQVLHAATFAAHHSASLKRCSIGSRGRCRAGGRRCTRGISYGVGGTLGGLVMGWTWKVLAPAHTFGLAAAAAAAGAVCAAMSFRVGPSVPGAFRTIRPPRVRRWPATRSALAIRCRTGEPAPARRARRGRRCGNPPRSRADR